ncbi:MAG: hypothetical protein WD052_06320 [Bacteroidales bacterium]
MIKHLLLILSVFISQNIIAQIGQNKYNYEIGIGISDFGEFLNYKTTKGVINLNTNFWLSKHVDVGVQAGIGRQFDQYGTVTNNSIGMYLFKYSTISRFHFLQLPIKSQDSKIDFYLKGILGGQTVKRVEEFTSPNVNTEVDYGIYFGIRYNPIWLLGIYGEIGAGRFSYSQFGLSLKF